MATQIFTWWLVLQVFGLLGLPIAAFLFQSLPDRGYAFSKSLGLLLTGYIAWMLAMFGLGSFGVPLVLLVMVLVGVLGVVLLPISTGVSWRNLPMLWAWLSSRLRRHWRGILAYETLFLLAMLLLAWIRSHHLGFVGPQPWGTERPMDFAFLNAIRYSGGFPPVDPWLSGFSINYYYFGYLLMAVVALLSGLEPGVAYNLALASIFALTALGVAGIISNLVSLTLRRRQQTDTLPDQGPSWRAYIGRGGVALLGVVMVLLVGNQAGALQVVVGNPKVVALDGPQLVSAVGQALGGAEQIDLPHPAYTSDFDTLTTLERTNRIEDFDWWWPSRALWDSYPIGEPVTTEAGEQLDTMRRYTITEFPFFSFWLGDMHPHVMALPFNLLALALVLATLTRPTLPSFTTSRTGWLELAFVGLILGSLYTINSWDLPTYVLLYVGALFLCHVRAAGSLATTDWKRLSKQVALVAVALIALFLPFHMTFHSLVGFKAPWILLPGLSQLSQIIAPFVVDKSGLHTFLMIFGLFALPLFTFIFLTIAVSRREQPVPLQQHTAALPEQTDATPPDAAPTESAPTAAARIRVSQSGAHGAMLIEEQPAVLPARLPWVWLLPWLPLLLLVPGWLIGFPLLALAGVALVAFYQAMRRTTAPAEQFALLVGALGCAIVFGTELIYIRDVFESGSSRMNTVFKFYYQVWLLWGTAAAFALWWLLTLARGTNGQAGHFNLLHRIVAYGTSALFVALLVGGLIYPVLNLRDVAQNGTWMGLEGHTPRAQTPAGEAAIAWLRENTPPGSVVLEMVGPGGGSYNTEGYAGISASTGRPTVLGWFGHQLQWRGGDPIAREQLTPRQEDVERIYSTTDPAEALVLLRAYNVDYVYVGELERAAYDAESLAKFNQIAEPVFSQGNVTIYRLPDTLDG
jgi:YYY domain-containing protein